MFKILVQLSHIKKLSISEGCIRRYVIKSGHENPFRWHIMNYFEKINVSRATLDQYEVSAQVRKTATQNDSNPETFQSIYQQINYLAHQNYDQNFISTIDVKCLNLINSLTHSQILRLLSLLLKSLSATELINTQFYNDSMDVLFQALEYELLNRQDIVQLSFFISLRKDKARSYMIYLKPFLSDIQDLDLVDKCIIAEAFYKSSVKLSESQSRALEVVLSSMPQELISNSHLLVPLCKAIRLSKPTSQLDLTNLSNAIIDMKQPLNIMAAIHILSLYAEALVHEPDAVAHLVKDCMKIMENNISSLRLKDVDRFLWSISHLGYHLDKDEKQLLMRIMEERLQELKMKGNVGFLVNSLLSLHILECWNPELIKECFEESVFESIYYEKFHWKVRSRLHLLVCQINIEMNLKIPEALRKEIRIAYTVPEQVDAAAQILNKLIDDKTVQSIAVECPVKGLLIPGITLETEKCLYHIDLLNNFTCLRNTSIPHGLMQLKSRLITHLKYHHILVEDVKKEDPDVIRSTVKEQINKYFSKS